MSLQFSYSLFAPFYDALIERASARIRASNLAHIPHDGGLRVLINGIGTGLDLPFAPAGNDYTGVDLTAAMLRQARVRARQHGVRLVQGNCLALPFARESFDCVVLHLILAVVPDPRRCLAETARVLKPGGRVLVLDKFLRRGQLAPLRRLLTPLSGRIATRMDVVFEDVLAAVPGFEVEADEPALARGWFRAIRLRKAA